MVGECWARRIAWSCGGLLAASCSLLVEIPRGEDSAETIQIVSTTDVSDRASSTPVAATVNATEGDLILIGVAIYDDKTVTGDVDGSPYTQIGRFGAAPAVEFGYYPVTETRASIVHANTEPLVPVFLGVAVLRHVDVSNPVLSDQSAGGRDGTPRVEIDSANGNLVFSMFVTAGNVGLNIGPPLEAVWDETVSPFPFHIVAGSQLTGDGNVAVESSALNADQPWVAVALSLSPR